MSLQCPTSPVYHTSVQQKLQSQKSAKAYRYGTPKLRELLREKCRIRLREARQLSFGRSRNIFGDDAVEDAAAGGGSSGQNQLGISEILRQELAELEKDIDLQEKIYKELVDEVDEWFVEQLEEEEKYLINVGESNDVICPICQKATLWHTSLGYDTRFTCGGEGCGINFCFHGDSSALSGDLQANVDKHEECCLEKLQFFATPNNNSEGDERFLSVICQKCGYSVNLNS